MKDYVGHELAEGQHVVHGVGGRCGGLNGPYLVHSLSPKMVRLQRPGREGVWKTVPPQNLVIVGVPV